MKKDTLITMVKKPTFIFFAGLPDYWKIANLDLYRNPDVFVCEGVGNAVLNKLNRVHNAGRFNRKGELPFKSIWFDLYSCAPLLDKEKTQYIVFTENNFISFSEKYLRYLRSNYPKLVMLFEFTNVCGKYNNLGNLSRVRHLYDHVITFNEADSKRYGLIFQPLCYSYCEPALSDFPDTDVLFIGKNKGRLPLLLSIYDRLVALGLHCAFYITNITFEQQVKRKGIIYEQYMPYRDVLKHVNHASCILDILEDNSHYFSLRTYEALVYRKKLITATPDILRLPFYSPSQMLYMKTPENITKAFFETPIVNKYDIAAFSPNTKLQRYASLTRLS